MRPHRLLRSARDEPHGDAGLQAERTAMAWQRTALGVGGVSALLLHQAGGRLSAAWPGLVGLAMATALLALSERRYERSVTRSGFGQDPLSAPLMALMALTVSALAVLAIGLLVATG